MKNKYRNYSRDYSFAKIVDLDDENETPAVKEAVEEEPSVAKELQHKIEKLVERPGRINVLSNLREGPSLDSNILAVMPAGDNITIQGTEGDFHKVIYNGTKGYVKKDLCTLL